MDRKKRSFCLFIKKKEEEEEEEDDDDKAIASKQILSMCLCLCLEESFCLYL
jgi:hypothetical protein